MHCDTSASDSSVGDCGSHVGNGSDSCCAGVFDITGLDFADDHHSKTEICEIFECSFENVPCPSVGRLLTAIFECSFDGVDGSSSAAFSDSLHVENGNGGDSCPRLLAVGCLQSVYCACIARASDLDRSEERIHIVQQFKDFGNRMAAENLASSQALHDAALEKQRDLTLKIEQLTALNTKLLEKVRSLKGAGGGVMHDSFEPNSDFELFKLGANVVLHSLHRHELNGMLGIVAGHDPRSNRFLVYLQDESTRKFKSCNLHVFHPPRSSGRGQCSPCGSDSDSGSYDLSKIESFSLGASQASTSMSANFADSDGFPFDVALASEGLC
mmetsp:Transcript_62023/g.117488  ORF Transcript_62023/g.117488 Transcript_62023/m.117488 type:complete len:327 (+) Transcript_62023:1141-2121(+)